MRHGGGDVFTKMSEMNGRDEGESLFGQDIQDLNVRTYLANTTSAMPQHFRCLRVRSMQLPQQREPPPHPTYGLPGGSCGAR